MSVKDIIKDKFTFLTEKKFKFKATQKNSEMQVVFTKDNFQLEFFIDNYSENLDVVVSNGIQRINITNFPFSDNVKTYMVQQVMAMPGLISKINGMSQLISEYLNELMMT